MRPFTPPPPPLSLSRRHNYGKEGKRADYTAFPCTRIIMGAAPGTDDDHGCPFRHWDATRLRANLARQQIAPAMIDKILKEAAERNYQIACRSHFEARFPGADSGSVGNHPNAYFEAAQSFLKAKAAGGATLVGPVVGVRGGGAAGGAEDVPIAFETSGAPGAAGAGVA